VDRQTDIAHLIGAILQHRCEHADLPIVQPVIRHYTAWATAVLVLIFLLNHNSAYLLISFQGTMFPTFYVLRMQTVIQYCGGFIVLSVASVCTLLIKIRFVTWRILHNVHKFQETRLKQLHKLKVSFQYCFRDRLCNSCYEDLSQRDLSPMKFIETIIFSKWLLLAATLRLSCIVFHCKSHHAYEKLRNVWM
jgi:hypothetical protein